MLTVQFLTVRILWALGLAAIAIIIVAVLEDMLNAGDNWSVTDTADNSVGWSLTRVVLFQDTKSGWIKAIVFGLVAAAMWMFSHPLLLGLKLDANGQTGLSAGWLVVAFAIVTALAQIGLVLIWRKDGEFIREGVCFTLITGVLLFVGLTAAKVATEHVTSNAFWASALMLFPALMALVAVCSYLINGFSKAAKRAEDDEAEAQDAGEEGDEDLENRFRAYRIGRWVVIALLILGALALLVFGLKWGVLFNNEDEIATKASEEEVITDNETPTQQTTNSSLQADGMAYNTATNVVWHDYTLDLLQDTDPSNDFNFGPNPTNKDWKAADYDEDLRVHMINSPWIGAAILGSADAKIGTRFNGVFYDQVQDQWDYALNLAANYFAENSGVYFLTLDQFFALLDRAEVKVMKASGIKDQLYMMPYTIGVGPDIIVAETDVKSDDILVYTIPVKNGATVQLAFRIACCYQPLNVAVAANVKAASNPYKGDDGGDKGGDNGDNNGNKDKTKGTQGIPANNADDGAGKDTNNGVGATISAADNINNSGFMTLDDYKKEVEKQRELDANQREGGDSNEASSTPPAGYGGITVDNNGQNGTGYGGIDAGTAYQQSHSAETGQQYSSESDGVSWDSSGI